MDKQAIMDRRDTKRPLESSKGQNHGWQQYLDSSCWQCPDAPINPAVELQVINNTGAHHWLKFAAGKNGEFYCRYCFIIRRFKKHLDGGSAISRTNELVGSWKN